MLKLTGPPEEAAQQLIKHLQATGVLDARGEVQPLRGPQRGEQGSEARLEQSPKAGLEPKWLETPRKS